MKKANTLTVAILALMVTPLSISAGVPGSSGGLIANTGHVTVESNSFVDSYNSSNGYYGRGNVGANASAYACKTVTIAPGAYFKGLAYNAADAQLHLVNFSVPTTLRSAGDFNVAAGASATLADGDYLFDSFTLGSEAYLEIQGNVRVWVSGNVSISGEVDSASPKAFWIMGSENTGSVQITGTNTVFSGNIYAPSAAITVSQAEVYGSLTGASVDIQSGSSIHFDEATPALAAGLQVIPAAVQAAVPTMRIEKMQLGPVPSMQGQPICLFSPKPTDRTDWNVFNAAGERVASLDFGNESSQCWTPSGLGAGVYMVHIAAAYFDGTSSSETRKVVVRN